MIKTSGIKKDLKKSGDQWAKEKFGVSASTKVASTTHFRRIIKWASEKSRMRTPMKKRIVERVVTMGEKRRSVLSIE